MLCTKSFVILLHNLIISLTIYYDLPFLLLCFKFFILLTFSYFFFFSFKPWSWFLDDINELKATCQLGNNTCTSRDMVFIIDEAAPTAITTASVFQTDETQQFNEDVS